MIPNPMKSLSPALFSAACLVLTGLAGPALAQHHDHASGTPAAQTGHSATADPTDTWTDAEVRRVDVAAKKISLKHGPIVNLDMPPMSMVFQVEDAALLNGLQAGDKVRFVARQQQGAYWAIRIERQTP